MWGPVEGHNSWPGKVVEVMDNSMVLVCWYGGRTVSQVYKHLIYRKINTRICTTDRQCSRIYYAHNDIIQ